MVSRSQLVLGSRKREIRGEQSEKRLDGKFTVVADFVILSQFSLEDNSFRGDKSAIVIHGDSFSWLGLLFW